MATRTITQSSQHTEAVDIFIISPFGVVVKHCKEFYLMDNIQSIQTTNFQTPIEIALGIDENGMTVARKLLKKRIDICC